jgi:CRP-like cAMP-binding protein
MSLESDVKLLAGLKLFSAMTVESLKLIAFAAETRSFKAGDVLFRQGELSHGGYVVVSGTVALDPSQNGAAAARIIGPGGLLGELALLVATRNPVTAIARENSTILKISRTLFLRTLEESIASARSLKTALRRDLQAFVLDLEQVGNSSPQ